MKNVLKTASLVGMLFGSLVFTSCSKEDSNQPANISDGLKSVSYKAGAEYCGQVASVNLIAGQFTNVGSVSVGNDNDSIYVTYTTTGQWRMRQLHLYVGKCSMIPITKSGNPIPGQFPYTKRFGSYSATTYTFSFPRTMFDSCFCVAAHAEVARANGSGAETAWGQGTRFVKKGNWGMYFSACKQPCVDPCAPKPFEGCAYTPGSLFDAEGSQYLNWPDATLSIGGFLYTKSEITDLYALRLETNDAWRAFIAIAAIKASGQNVASDEGILCKVAEVEAWLSSLNKLDGNNLPSPAPSAVAGAISTLEQWIAAHPC